MIRRRSRKPSPRNAASSSSPWNFRITRTIAIDLNETGYTSFEGHGVGRITMAGKGRHSASSARICRVRPSHKRLKPTFGRTSGCPASMASRSSALNPEADAIEASGTMQLTITRVRHQPMPCTAFISSAKTATSSSAIATSTTIAASASIYDRSRCIKPISSAATSAIATAAASSLATVPFAISTSAPATSNRTRARTASRPPTFYSIHRATGTGRSGDHWLHHSAQRQSPPNSANIRILAHADQPEKAMGSGHHYGQHPVRCADQRPSPRRPRRNLLGKHLLDGIRARLTSGGLPAHRHQRQYVRTKPSL